VRSPRKIPLAEFADELGVSRDTARRLFQRNVFPDEWLEISPDDNRWFVWIDEERLPIARDTLRLWKAVRRKPKALNSFYLSDLISTLAMALFEIRCLGRAAANGSDLDLVKSFLASGCPVLGEIVDQLRGRARSQEGASMLLVAQRLTEIRERFGEDYVPTPQELAEWLGCCVASLYRKPYGGTEILNEASRLIEEHKNGGSVEDVNRLARSGDAAVDSERIRWALAVTPARAEDLFEEWSLHAKMETASALGAIQDDLKDCSWRPEPSASELPDSLISKPKETEDFWRPDPSSREQLDSSSSFVKKAIGRRHTRKLKKKLLVWEQLPGSIPAMRLCLVPERAHGIVKRYSETKFPKISESSFAAASSQLDCGTEPLGCILAEAGRILVRIFDGGITPDHFADSINEAAETLLSRVRRAPAANRIDPVPDWDDLLSQGVNLWNSRSNAPVRSTREGSQERPSF